MAIKKKAAPKKAVTKKTAPKKAVTTANTKKTESIEPIEANQSEHIGQAMSDGTRYKMVSDAAYFYAEKEDFQGDNIQHWLKAEADIDALLKNK